MNTAAVKVGRLLEVRADSGYRTVADVLDVFKQIERELAKLPPGTRHLVVADWRECPVMSPTAAQHMAASIARFNENLLRSAALTREAAPTAVLQFLRVIRETNHPDRQLFCNSADLVQWLSEVATPEEAQRLRDFLSYR